jgi:phosphomannomutase/phosphoglucomutase
VGRTLLEVTDSNIEINPSIFREYDIRGVVGKDLSPEVADTLGKAFGTMARSRKVKTITLGRDNRLSSPELSSGFMDGLLSTGCEVIDLGMVPSPVLYFSLFHLSPGGGVMVTGSHNPPEYNGFKVALGRSTIWGKDIQELWRIIHGGQFASGQGRSVRRDIVEPYRRMMVEKIRLSRELKVVVDAGSGTAGPLACRLLRELGCKVIELYCEPDGSYPGHFPDPTIPSNMEEAIEAVEEHGADLAVSFDGDADRLGVVDDGGRILWGDDLLIIFSRDILKRHPGAGVVFEVKCSDRLKEDILDKGGRPFVWKTGHSLIKDKMKAEGALLAGEMSGHLFFADDYFGYDDAIYASLRLLEIVARSGSALSTMLADIPPRASTPELRIPCPDEEKFSVVEKITEHFRERYEILDIDGVRITFPQGWGLVRASNTQPILVMRFEAENPEALEAIKDEVLGKLKELTSAKIPGGL